MLGLRAFVEEGGLSFGKWQSLPLSRRFIVDYLNFAQKVPSQPMARDCDVSRLVDLRSCLPQRVGWSAICMKAYAVMAAQHPELWASFMRWPWPHLYQHSHQVGRVAVSRHADGEDWLFFTRIERPETRSLYELQGMIEHAQHAPAEEVPIFRLQQVFSRLPGLLRRFIFWATLNLSGAFRSGIVGTVGLSSVASLGASSLSPPSLGNIVISFAPLTDTGQLRVTFVYDHRVFDGSTVARYLEEFEEVLTTVMVEEMQILAGPVVLKAS